LEKQNQEPKTFFKTPDLVADIKKRILEWLGIVIKLGLIRAAKKISETKAGGGRKVVKFQTEMAAIWRK
jgi:hypothetical protein